MRERINLILLVIQIHGQADSIWPFCLVSCHWKITSAPRPLDASTFNLSIFIREMRSLRSNLWLKLVQINVNFVCVHVSLRATATATCKIYFHRYKSSGFPFRCYCLPLFVWAPFHVKTTRKFIGISHLFSPAYTLSLGSFTYPPKWATLQSYDHFYIFIASRFHVQNVKVFFPFHRETESAIICTRCIRFGLECHCWQEQCEKKKEK